MRNWTIIVLVILVLCVAALGYFNIKQSLDLNNSQADVTALQARDQSSQQTISALQSSMTALNTNLSTLQSAIATLQTAAPTTISNTMVNLIPQIEPIVARIDVSRFRV